MKPDGKPAAVSTVYRDDFAHIGLQNAPPGVFYFFRTFIQLGDRVPNLSKKITTCTYDYLKTFSEPEKPQGLIIIAENPKLTKAVIGRQLGALGWMHIGEDSRGKLIWRLDF